MYDVEVHVLKNLNIHIILILFMDVKDFVLNMIIFANMFIQL